jgi:cytochrome c oxidase subunit 2
MRLRLLPILFFSILAGCAGPQNMLGPAGPAARHISNLGWFVFITFCVVAVVMWALLVWAAVGRRGNFSEHDPVDIGGGHDWVIIGGFVIPFVILATIFVLGLNTLAAFPVHDGAHAHPEIRVTGHQWWWNVEYVGGPVDQHFRTANEIHIPVGRPVDIELATADVIHSFWVPKLHGKVDTIPGQVNLIRVQADQPGTYRGQCAEFCGAQHANMKLLVAAQPEPAFEAWAANQHNSSLQPANDEQAKGQELFMNRPCEFCRAIRGRLAHGMVGPDLTHLASRQAIASNMLPNNTASLSAWVSHAQALKPASAMPNVSQFDGPQLHALVAYLQSLR